MNTNWILLVCYAVTLFISLFILWTFWIDVWITICRRRLPRRQTADPIGLALGILFPVSVPAGAMVILAILVVRAAKATLQKAGGRWS